MNKRVKNTDPKLTEQEIIEIREVLEAHRFWKQLSNRMKFSAAFIGWIWVIVTGLLALKDWLQT